MTLANCVLVAVLTTTSTKGPRTILVNNDQTRITVQGPNDTPVYECQEAITMTRYQYSLWLRGKLRKVRGSGFKFKK